VVLPAPLGLVGHREQAGPADNPDIPDFLASLVLPDSVGLRERVEPAVRAGTLDSLVSPELREPLGSAVPVGRLDFPATRDFPASQGCPEPRVLAEPVVRAEHPVSLGIAVSAGFPVPAELPVFPVPAERREPPDKVATQVSADLREPVGPADFPARPGQVDCQVIAAFRDLLGHQVSAGLVGRAELVANRVTPASAGSRACQERVGLVERLGHLASPVTRVSPASPEPVACPELQGLRDFQAQVVHPD